MKTLDTAGTILVGEDELEVLGYFDIALKCLGYDVETAQDGDEVLSCLRSSRSEISAVLLDIFMANRDGLDTLREIRKFDPAMPVIVVSGVASPQNIVTAIKNGATDFLCKPVAHEDLDRALRKALETRNVSGSPLVRLPIQPGSSFLCTSLRMREIQGVIGQIGWSEVPVLIQGETGTGKEVLARELHAHSPRADKLFLKLNCAALPSELVESELFGYERGAFTGAVQKKVGMFEMADGGTILLDEIGDMDLRLQAKLLQVLQDHEFRRIGGKEIVKVDVRVIAATHRDLEKSIIDQTFRQDLYYRLSVVNLHVPPLRDRREDIIPLAEFLLSKYAPKASTRPNLNAELRCALMEYHWPGNVRELENCIRKLTIMPDADAIARELHAKSNVRPLTPKNGSEPTVDSPPRQEEVPILEQVNKAKYQAEKTAILTALGSTRWNRKQAAALLNIDYKALLYKMKKLGIDDQPSAVPVRSESSSSVMSQAATVGGN
jgi:two-component system, NtrC family, response regulator AtoC